MEVLFFLFFPEIELLIDLIVLEDYFLDLGFFVPVEDLMHGGVSRAA